MAALLRHLSQDLVDGKLAQQFFFSFLSFFLLPPFFFNQKEEHSLLLFLFLLLVAELSETPNSGFVFYFPEKRKSSWICDPLGLFVVFIHQRVRRPLPVCSPLSSPRRPVRGRVPALRSAAAAGRFVPSLCCPDAGAPLVIPSTLSLSLRPSH